MKWPAVLASGACVGADPLLFDSVGGDRVIDALSYCERCTVTQECLNYVRPRRSYYDGVVAGKVWQDGKPVEAGLFDEGVA